MKRSVLDERALDEERSMFPDQVVAKLKPEMCARSLDQRINKNKQKKKERNEGDVSFLPLSW